MKNLIEIQNNIKCSTCKTSGFFCWTPGGGDYVSCPCCQGIPHGIYDDSDDDSDGAEDPYPVYEDGDIRSYPFCKECKIVYECGCKHLEMGCTDDTLNGHFIGKWQDTASKEVYVGMPQFESVDEWLETGGHVKVLEWVCPNRAVRCTGGCYPIGTHPEYDRTCSVAAAADTGEGGNEVDGVPQVLQ